MTRFQDGPAVGQALMLHRAARFLRVTKSIVSGVDKWDALDQLEDQPKPNETLFAYEIVNKPIMCHVNAGRRTGFYPMAKYKFVNPQPTDADMRTEEAWDAWCKSRNM